MLKKYDKPIAYGLIGLGVLQLILFIIQAIGLGADPLTQLIYQAFFVSGIYVPLLSFWGAFLILRMPLNYKLAIYTGCSVFIFFPISSIIKLLFSDRRDPFLDLLSKLFDRPGSSTGSVIILIFIASILVLTSRLVAKIILKEKILEEVKDEPIKDKNKEPIVTTLNETLEPILHNEYLEEEEDKDKEDLNAFDVSVAIDQDEDVDQEDNNSIKNIKDKISSYFIEEESKNIPFKEPQLPGTTDEVDIDAYDASNAELSQIVLGDLSNDEVDYLKSFEEVETFKPSELDSPEIIHDPAYDFLTSAEDDESYQEENETYEDDNESYQEENETYEDDNESYQEENETYEDDNESYLDDNETYEDDNVAKEYIVPVDNLLVNNPDNSYMEIDEATKRSAAILEQTLEEFNIKGKVTGIKKGPVITMFELLPAPGVKLSKIVSLSDNIALGLAASSVRIVAPIPGKHAVGIEVPNKKRGIVSFGELIEDDNTAYTEDAIPIVLGKDISGDNKIIDLAKTPHLLIAGATGAGKSVCVNSLICSILCKRSHNDVKMIMVDPKIVELKLYNGIPHLLTPVITDPKKAFQAIQWCLYEMERRYALLDSIGVRDIKSYNNRIKEQKLATTKLPYLVLIVDEFADLMATSGKELEAILARLAAMSRAVGIHLVLATQRPSIDVITGLIKANFPSRIAFMVSSKTDSRIILDNSGAEKLLGRGDMLFTSSWDPFPVRIQGSFLSDEEVESVVDYVKTLGEPDYIDDEIFLDDEEEDGQGENDSYYGDDPLFNRALDIVITAKKASASFIQRRLKIGYNRAARLVEEMEERGIIGPQNGSKPRDILRIPDSHREIDEFV